MTSFELEMRYNELVSEYNAAVTNAEYYARWGCPSPSKSIPTPAWCMAVEAAAEQFERAGKASREIVEFLGAHPELRESICG